MNRRNFIKNVGTTSVAVATLPSVIDGFTVKALAGGDAMGRLLEDSDRVFVIIQLTGGNDGLNTVILVDNDIYYNNRPKLAIAKNKALSLTDTLRLHPSLSGFKKLYDEGQLAIVQGVTYPNPDRSHFRGTDIWLTATDASVFGSTGWVGRYLDILAPGFPTELPEHPLAVQVGGTQSLGFAGSKGSMGITFRDPDEFARLVSTGGGIEEVPAADLGDTKAAAEVEFVRNVARSADVYATVVKTAADAAPTSTVTYPNSDIAAKLRVVAQLIAGGLQSKVFLVSWENSSFDTHANQVVGSDPLTGAHANLLSDLGGAVEAFMADMKNSGNAGRVAGMTFSEFGRRVAENGSLGTDHGTAAPLFVFGENVLGSVIGADPDLETLDNRGDLLMNYDFRDIYASVLLQWFAQPSTVVNNILYHDFSKTAVPLFKGASKVLEGAAAGSTIQFRSVSPNPASDVVTVRVHMNLVADATVVVHSMHGKKMLSAEVNPVSGVAQFNVSGLSTGNYILGLYSGGAVTHSLLSVQR